MQLQYGSHHVHTGGSAVLRDNHGQTQMMVHTKTTAQNIPADVKMRSPPSDNQISQIK
jgi:hypothetical protein